MKTRNNNGKYHDTNAEIDRFLVGLNIVLVLLDIIGVSLYCNYGDVRQPLYFKCILGCIVSSFWSWIINVALSSFDKKTTAKTKKVIWIWFAYFVLSFISVFIAPKMNLQQYRGFAVVASITQDNRSKSIYLKVLDRSFVNYGDRYEVATSFCANLHTLDTVLVVFRADSLGNVGGFEGISLEYDDSDKKKYYKPVKIEKGQEIGNDYWYYAQMFPEIEYKNFGYNLVYKATFDFHESALHFTDVCGMPQSIKYSPKNYADTFLVFHNINEEIDDRFVVCAPEVNTPENWKKISDYGYIFHYDVYSKEEIESQCPRIRNYVEKYKERMKGK